MSDLHAPNTPEVDAFMTALDHPLKAEIQAVREMIKSADPGITEQIKWSAPSFSYKDDYVVTFFIRSPKELKLVWHHPRLAEVKSEILVDPKPDGRRFSNFSDMAGVRAAEGEIVRVVRELIGG